MNNGRGRNFTVDITKPSALKIVRALLDEFIPWFKGRWFHIGPTSTRTNRRSSDVLSSSTTPRRTTSATRRTCSSGSSTT